MTNSNKLEKIAAHNQRSLNTLTRAIAMGKDKFSLIVLRCNYDNLQGEIFQLLRQKSSLEIKDFVVPKSAVSLYTAIKEYLGDKSPAALMVCDLESVKNLDFLLQSANRLRDKFRNFTLPIVLLLTDLGLKKLMQQAPDFSSFASAPIRFSLPDEELGALICRRVDAAVNDADNFQIKGAEIEALRQDLAGRELDLGAETRACFAFLDAWDLARNKQVDGAVAKYRECLRFWEENKDVLRRGVVQLFIAQAYLTLKKPGFFEKPGFWEAREKAKDYFRESFKSFAEANRLDLKARHIGKLAALLQQLEYWQSLEEIVTNEALPLHLEYGGFVAEDYGFLAVAAVQQSKWREAATNAKLALEALPKEDNARYWSLYLLVLALAKLQLNEVENALAKLTEAKDYLEAAREEDLPEDDARLLVKIIEQLQNCLLEKRQYSAAFNCKLTVKEIKSQYRWIAFIGAGRLQPSLKVINAGEKTAEEKGKIKGEILAASGRKPDLERLIKRIKHNDKKLTVIYGKSGVGKSSLLQAGLVPVMELDNFEGRDYLPVLLRRYQHWDEELFEKLNHSCKSLQNCLEWLEQNQRFYTLLIFDQFEEFFFDNPDAKTRQEFYQFLGKCLNISDLKVVFSLREDYLHYFFELLRDYIESPEPKSKIDSGYKNIFYYLGDLKPEDARQIIEGLTARSEIRLEADLISQLVTDLAGELGGVRPIELQIVGTQLETERITTLRKYQEKGEQPKEILVKQFLEKAVLDCGEENRRAAELVLYLLTNEDKKRPLKRESELKEDLKILEIEEEKLKLVLKVLEGSGLMLLLRQTPENLYQLVHDYLVELIRGKYEPRTQELELTKQQLKEARQEAIIESSIAFAYAATTLMSSKQPFKARLTALKAGRKLLDWHLSPPTERASIVTDTLRQIAYKKENELFRESNRLSGHQGWVNGASFSLDGKLIASASSDNTVKLWNRQGNELQTLRGHEDSVNCVSFSPDGKLIATASDDKTVKLWNRQGQELQTLTGHEGPARGVSFSPDGELIASASDDNTVKLWNSQGEFLETLNGHEGWVNCVSFSPDGGLIATASSDKTVKLWNREGELLETLSGHKSDVNDVSFSPNGKLIATASDDNTVKLWNREGGLLETLSGHEGPVWGVSFSPDGELIASASDDNTVKLWNRQGKELQTLTGHEGPVYGVSFSPDGELVAAQKQVTSSRGLNLRPSKAETGKLLLRDSLIATASSDKTVKLWSFEDRQLQSLRGVVGRKPARDDENASRFLESETAQAHKGPVYGVSFSPDGELIASASSDKTVKLWNPQGKELQILKRHSDVVNGVSFSPDGELIASASSDNTVKLWNRQGKESQTLTGHEGPVRGVSFSPDGELIASASSDKTVKLWNRQGKVLQTLRGHEDGVNGASFSPDGELIASASRDNTVKLWNSQGEFLETLNGHEGWVNCVSFSPDGELIATASSDKTVKLWNSQGEFLEKLSVHERWVNSVSFSPDGKLIASASDKTVKLWNFQGELLETLSGHENWVNGLSFSPDGKLIASASADGTVILWDVWDFKDLMRLNCQLVGGYLRNNPNVEESDRGLCDGFDVGE